MDVSQYLEIFIDETSEHLQNLSDCIMELEKDPENMDTINEIFRAAHSLKGMAGTMGFKRMQRLTHDMENVFQEVRSEKVKVTSSMIDLLFKCLDAIEGYLDNVKASSDEGTEDNELIIKELNDFIAAEDGAAAAPAPAQAEPKKEEAPAQTAGGDDKKYFEFGLSESEKDKIKQAEEGGAHIYGMTIYIQKECLLKAARAFLVFKAVEEFGEILVYNPSSQDIEDEKFDCDFSIFIASDEPYEKIAEAAKSVSEIDKVVGEEVKYETLAAKQEKAEADAAAAEKSQDAPAEAAPAQEQPQAQAVKPAAKTQSSGNKKQTVAKPVTNRTVRVDIEKLDALMNQVSELIIAKNSLVSISSTDSGDFQNQSFHEQIEYLERITTNLHESVMKVRMVPIRQTVIKPHLQSFRPESLHPLPDQILAAQGRVQGLIVRIISFEQTKTFVVLGGDHRILHTRSLRHLCPLTRIIQIRIEQVEILFRIFHQNLLIAHHPPISGRQGVQSSMDKPTETVACPPNHPFLLFLFRLILNLTLYLTCRSQ